MENCSNLLSESSLECGFGLYLLVDVCTERTGNSAAKLNGKHKERKKSLTENALDVFSIYIAFMLLKLKA